MTEQSSVGTSHNIGLEGRRLSYENSSLQKLKVVTEFVENSRHIDYEKGINHLTAFLEYEYQQHTVCKEFVGRI